LKFGEQQLSKLQELDQLKSHFFANISHEFRTPLTLILNPIKAILAKTRDKKIVKELSLVERNASKLLQMVNQLLDLSKLEAGKMKKSIIVGDIARSIRIIASSFNSLAKYKSITYKKVFILDNLVTDFNENHLEKILNNVLSNAFKFTQEQGKVTLLFDFLNIQHETMKPDSISLEKISGIKFTIRDTGVGIDQSALPHIFDRFYQEEGSSNRNYEGTGIGLALAKDLVELYNGEINVKSEIGWGTEITIILPLEKVYAIDESYAADEVKQKVPNKISDDHISSDDDQIEEVHKTTNSENGILLVVEDNIDLREHIRDLLQPDYNILEAENGVAGLNIAIEQVPDLIISDVMMPEMDGIELTGNLKKDQRTSHIPIILLTAKSSMEDKLTGLKTGADEYLAKPFDAEELKVRIENLIQIRTHLQSQFSNDPQLSKISTGLTQEEQFLKKAKTVIDINIENDQFSVEDLSSELGMSRVQFHRKIKALTNQSTTSFIRTIRLEKAKELLAQGNYNVTEVAYMVGFSSQSYFTKSFQKHFGTPPSNFQG
jgi:DNA-binding response OmpR family regulator/nitrogen-specific signal transduction histidine kinase